MVYIFLCAAIAHRNHHFHQYHQNVTPENMKLFCDSHNLCKSFLRDARFNYAKTTRRSVASQLIRSCDFWSICNSVLNRWKSIIPPIYNGPEVMTKLTSLLQIFHAIQHLMMVPNSILIFHHILNRDLDLRISQPKWFLLQFTILMHPKPLALQNSSHCP